MVYASPFDILEKAKLDTWWTDQCLAGIKGTRRAWLEGQHDRILWGERTLLVYDYSGGYMTAYLAKFNELYTQNISQFLVGKSKF